MTDKFWRNTLNNLPRLRFAHLPTAVEELPRLSNALDSPHLLVKRDDQTGLAMGGNKTRKLEFLVAEARAHGARTLITAGALQSNHCRQTAAAAARFGFDCILVLTSSNVISKIPKLTNIEDHHLEEIDSSAKPPTGNMRLYKLLGAELVSASSQEREFVLQQTFQNAWDEGRRPYLIPYGGSNAIGAAAYVNAMKELLEQCQQSSFNLPEPDWIVFPSSSGGTQAGLVLGARIFGYKGQILGISIDETASILQERVATLALETADILGEKKIHSKDDIFVNADYLGDGYGVMGEPEKEAIRLFATYEGLLLDPVYTGRAAAGMIDLIRSGFFNNQQIVLFWHTGGTPAIFADKYQDLV
jgi:D-cysteine desulfhydrase family pyridoxal phosphate-dependent enzyme